MKKYPVQIKETLIKTITVEADNARQARDTVERQWKDGIHVLDSSHFQGANFTIPSRQERER